MQVLETLNKVLMNPTAESIFDLFDRDGFVRLNMFYASPISLKLLRNKLLEHSLLCWFFTETGLVFELEDQTVQFEGRLAVTIKGSHIFSLELDFDPVAPTVTSAVFLKDIEEFLRRCDACLFMTYFICIDSEILSNPLSRSVEYLAQRK